MSSDRVYIDLDGIMNRIREKIVSRGAVGIKGLGRLFRIADDDSNRSVDLHEELPKMLGDVGVLLNKTEIDELSRMLDRNGNGSISFNEFIYHFAPPMSQRRIDIVNKAFDHLDEDNNGVIELSDIERKYARDPTKKGASKLVFDNFLQCFDKNGDGTISRDEFMNYYRDISPNIDNDEYFVTLIKNAWRINE